MRCGCGAGHQDRDPGSNGVVERRGVPLLPEPHNPLGGTQGAKVLCLINAAAESGWIFKGW